MKDGRKFFATVDPDTMQTVESPNGLVWLDVGGCCMRIEKGGMLIWNPDKNESYLFPLEHNPYKYGYPPEFIGRKDDTQTL